MSAMQQGGGDGRGRPGRGEGPKSGGPARRMPPPDSTGSEAAYLAKLREDKTPVTVEMLDGEVFHGWIEYYDREMVKVNRDEGPNVFIRKRHIRLLKEA